MKIQSGSRILASAGFAGSLLLLSPGISAGTQPYSLSGNARFEIFNGLPAPITFAYAPYGNIVAFGGATVMQTPGPDPKKMTLLPGQLAAAGDPFDLPFFMFAGGGVFQQHTEIAVQLPGATATFRAGGRTGPPVVSFCAGDAVAPGYNPMCTNAGAPGNLLNGRMRYERTANQFGGPARAATTGTANVALPVSAGAPCSYLADPGCQAVIARATPLFAAGGAFGFSTKRTGAAPVPGRFGVKVDPVGRITQVFTGLGPGLANPGTSFAGPWTTGMLTISTYNNLGTSTQRFTLTGSDARVAGVGSISLVSGGIVWNALSGKTVNAGWLNLEVNDFSAVPAMSVPAALALGSLLAGAALAFARRRRARAGRP